MCGQIGIIFGSKRRTRAEQEYLCNLFMQMLKKNESCGPHTSGVAILKTNSSHCIFKHSSQTLEPIYENSIQKILNQVDNKTTILMGHTYSPPQDDIEHKWKTLPYLAGIILGTHDGSFHNATHLFNHLGLPFNHDMETELIFRLADRFSPDGFIDQVGLKKALAICHCNMSAVLSSILDPGTITILKGNKPLYIRVHRKYKVMVYASEIKIIDLVMSRENGWYDLEVPPMTMLTIRHENMRAYSYCEFKLLAQVTG